MEDLNVIELGLFAQVILGVLMFGFACGIMWFSDAKHKGSGWVGHDGEKEEK